MPIRRCPYAPVLVSTAFALTPLAAISIGSRAAHSQPIPDSTVGTEITPFDPDTSVVEGGTTVEQNLFHSFEAFNIDPGKRVFFFAPNDVNHIFSRVTGGAPSQIDGVLGTFGSDADLFFINPSGVIFGPEASLSVLGSFMATTADGVQLGTTGQFSATTPVSDNLLAIDPSAFFFSGLGQPSNILSSGNLQVPSGEALLLLGGDVTLDNGVLVALDGRVQLGALAAAGAVDFTTTQFSFLLPENLPRGDVQLSNDSLILTINLVSDQNGDVIISANDISITEESSIFTGVGPNLDIGDQQVGNVTIDATGDITLSELSRLGTAVLSSNTEGTNPSIGQSGDIKITGQNLSVLSGSGISSILDGSGATGDIIIVVQDKILLDSADAEAESFSNLTTGFFFGAEGQSGDINISAGTAEVTHNAFILAATSGDGDGGDIIIDAQDQVLFYDGGISSGVFREANGNGGTILISANTLDLFEDSFILTDSNGVGNAGNIQLTIRDRLTLRGDSIISNELETDGVGNGGDIEIITPTLEVFDGGTIVSGTDGVGDAGDIRLIIGERIVISGDDIDGNLIASGVSPNGVGDGGDIEIIAPNLEVLGTGQIDSGTSGMGDAGDIRLNIQESIVISGNDRLSNLITSAVSSTGVGNGGDIEIFTTSLEVLNGGQLNSVTKGRGNAGDIIIDASDFVVFDGAQDMESDIFPSAAFSSVDPGAQGDGGNVEISTGRLDITNRAQLRASTFSDGTAGDIIINASDSVRLMNVGEIIAGSRSDSPAGNITITTEQLSIENVSSLRTDTSSSVDGGNINLTLGNLLLLRDRSDINTEAGTLGVGGDGGNINIISPFIVAIPTENSDIQANAFEGDGGQVNITARGVFGIEPRPALTPLSDITASSQQGVSGIVAVNALDTSFIQGNLTTLPDQFINPDSLISNSCVDRSQTEVGSFTITGNRLSETPEAQMADLYSTGHVQALDTIDSASFNGEIIEPSSIYQTPDGRLVMGHSCQ